MKATSKKQVSRENKVADAVAVADVKLLATNYIEKNEEYMWKRIKHEFIQKIRKIAEKNKSVLKQDVEDYIYGYLKQLLTWLSYDHHSQQINRSAINQELKRKLKDMTKLATEAQQRTRRRDEKILKMEKLMNTFAQKLKDKGIQYKPLKTRKNQACSSKITDNHDNFLIFVKFMMQANVNWIQKFIDTIFSLTDQLNSSKRSLQRQQQFSTELLQQLVNKDKQVEGMKKRIINAEKNLEFLSNSINQILLKEEKSKNKLTKAQQKISRLELSNNEIRVFIESYARECRNLQQSLNQLEVNLIRKEEQLLITREENNLLKAVVKQIECSNEIKLKQINQSQIEKIRDMQIEYKSEVQALKSEIEIHLAQIDCLKSKSLKRCSISASFSYLYAELKLKNSIETQTEQDEQEESLRESSEGSSYFFECDRGTQYDLPFPSCRSSCMSQIDQQIQTEAPQQQIQNKLELSKLREQLELMKKQEMITLRQIENLRIENTGAKAQIGQLRHRLINYLQEDHDDQKIQQFKQNEKLIRQLELTVIQLQNQNTKLQKNNEELLETIEYANSLFSFESVQKQNKVDFLGKNKIGYNFTDTTRSHSNDRSEKSVKSYRQPDYCATVSNYQAKCETQDEDRESKEELSQSESRYGIEMRENMELSHSFGGAVTRLLAEFVNQQNKQCDKLIAFTTLIELLKPESELNQQLNKYVKFRKIKNMVLEDQGNHEQMHKTELKDKLYKFLTQN